MARTSSGKSLPGFRSDSTRTGFRSDSGPTGSRVGMGRDGIEVKMEDRYAKELEWAAQHLPDEHAPFVAVTMEAIRCAGRRPTVGEVRDRLKALGRDRAAIDERARKYA